MGIFGRRQTVRPAPDNIDPRDIPQLHPDFYREVLAAAGKPRTADNMVAVAGLTASNLALNAHQWFEAIGTDEVRYAWKDRFDVEPDGDHERLVRVPDAMVDFLWQWDHRAHGGLRDFVSSMHGTAVSACREFGDVLPLDMWGGK